MNIPTIIKDNYYIEKKIGSGSFGEVWKAIEHSSKKMVAIKIEKKNNNSRLNYEYKIYNILKPTLGIPNTYWYGSMNNKNILIMDYLGPSLEDLFNFCNKNLLHSATCTRTQDAAIHFPIL